MAIVYDIASIPTSYGGRNYRSRLEARWAAMFDLFHWKYEYEPFDINGWFPDFSISCKNEKGRILVEVKPIDKPDLDLHDRLNKACPIDAEEILVLGSTIYAYSLCKNHDLDPCYVRLGWIRDYPAGWSEALLNLTYNSTDYPIGFYSFHGSYQDRITGIYDGDAHIGMVDPYDILEKWQEAGNRVQYKHGKRL